eukprot:PITA_19685
MMDVEKENLQCALHAVIVPFPAQSHVNVFINLAQLLAMRGFFVTFLTTEWIHKRMVAVSGTNTNSLISVVATGDPHHELEKRGCKIRFLCIPDGLLPDHEPTSSMGEYILALQKLSPALEHLLRSSTGCATADDAKYLFPPITCIVTDAFMSCTVEVASKMKIPRVIFWPISAAAAVCQCNSNFLMSQGHIPVKISEANNPEKLITCLPGNLPTLKPTDLLSYYRDPSGIMFNILLYESNMSSKGEYVLVNTFEELEGREGVTGLSSNGCPALAIGPLFLPNFLDGRDSTSSLLEEDEGCLRWLDMQQPESIIYISFGSIAVKSQEQLHQLALGLEGTGQHFLWVLRSDIAEGKPAVLPEGFEERTKDRALFVQWAPQLKVLAHAAVGLFITHCGWNSTLESISLGVPVVGLPHFGDQFLHCRFAKDVWKIGLDFEGVDVNANKLVTKEEVEDVVKTMMTTGIGQKLREKALKLKERAARAVLPGGSSFLNLNTFVEDMARKAAAQSNTCHS